MEVGTRKEQFTYMTVEQKKEIEINEARNRTVRDKENQRERMKQKESKRETERINERE